jgi:hypothetical protein
VNVNVFATGEGLWSLGFKDCCIAGAGHKEEPCLPP